MHNFLWVLIRTRGEDCTWRSWSTVECPTDVSQASFSLPGTQEERKKSWFLAKLWETGLGAEVVFGHLPHNTRHRFYLSSLCYSSPSLPSTYYTTLFYLSFNPHSLCHSSHPSTSPKYSTTNTFYFILASYCSSLYLPCFLPFLCPFASLSPLSSPLSLSTSLAPLYPLPKQSSSLLTIFRSFLLSLLSLLSSHHTVTEYLHRPPPLASSKCLLYIPGVHLLFLYAPTRFHDPIHNSS